MADPQPNQLRGKGELQILRALEPQASNEQLKVQLETALQNLQQEAAAAQLASEQTAESAQQPEANGKTTAHDLAQVTRTIIHFVQLGANTEEAEKLSSLAKGLERVRGDSSNDRSVVANAIEVLQKVISDNPAISAQARQKLEHDQVSMAEIHGSVDGLPSHLKEVVRKAIGGEAVNGPKKEAEKKTETNTANNDTTTNSSSPSRGLSPGSGG